MEKIFDSDLSKIYEYDNKILKKHLNVNTFVKEINVLNKIKNQKGFINHLEINNNTIIYPKMDGNITELAGKMNENQILKTFPILAQTLLSALVTLKTLNINHFDIKNDNILYQIVNEKINFFLADFGASTYHFNFEAFRGNLTTKWYEPLEVILNIDSKLYDISKLDIWSTGIVLMSYIYKTPYINHLTYLYSSPLYSEKKSNHEKNTFEIIKSICYRSNIKYENDDNLINLILGKNNNQFIKIGNIYRYLPTYYSKIKTPNYIQEHLKHFNIQITNNEGLYINSKLPNVYIEFLNKMLMISVHDRYDAFQLLQWTLEKTDFWTEESLIPNVMDIKKELIFKRNHKFKENDIKDLIKFFIDNTIPWYYFLISLEILGFYNFMNKQNNILVKDYKNIISIAYNCIDVHFDFDEIEFNLLLKTINYNIFNDNLYNVITKLGNIYIKKKYNNYKIINIFSKIDYNILNKINVEDWHIYILTLDNLK